MKKPLLSVVLAALCLNFSLKAQQPGNKPIDVTSKGIQIGQKIPETRSLSQYKGKFIILDFWATWCSPCVAMIPKMEALQEQFKGQLQIVPVTYQSDQEVNSFLGKLNNGKPCPLPQITTDKELHQLFPHIYLPHYIWIDQTGIVKAITGHHELTVKNIELLLTNKNATLIKKTDMQVSYDKSQPFLINGNGTGGGTLLSHSILTGFQEGIGGQVSKGLTGDKKHYKVSCLNVPRLKLFSTAWSGRGQYITRNRIITEVSDASRLNSLLVGEEYTKWQRTNAFCYELLIPADAHLSAPDYMQQDIRRMFPEYSIDTATRQMKSIVLKRTSAQDKLKSNGQKAKATIDARQCVLINRPLDILIRQLNVLYFQNSPMPVVDGTGYKGNVDINIQCSMTDLQDLNRALARYDLKFVEETVANSVLLIKDAINR